MKHLLCSLLVALNAAPLIAPFTHAQLPPDLPDPVEESLPDPLEPLPGLSPEPIDPLQLEDAIPDPTPDGAEEAPSTTFFIDDIQVIGNTRFQAEIEALIRPLEGRDVTLEDLSMLRAEITRLYVENGYISSGAVFSPTPDPTTGTVQIRVIEGEIEHIQINGLSHLQENYVRSRVADATAPPLRVQRLEEALQALQANPLLESVNAELTAGRGPGQNILILDLVEADPFFITVGLDNYRSPSVGSRQGTATMTHLNVLGLGDRLRARYDLTEGLDIYEVSYLMPVNPLDGSFNLRYLNAESRIVTPRFADAGIRSENETLSLGFRQPLTPSLTNELALGLSFDLRESRSFIFENRPFSFSDGPEDGVSKVRALRFSQEWVNRDINTVLAARSQFSVGLDIFDATVNNTGTDGHFFSWLGQFQWVEQVASNTLLVTRVNAQLTPDSLLPLERFSVGGIDTVRGYAQNELVTDNAITASTELRVPVADGLRLIPFIDAGGGWNTQTPNPDPSFLLGLGLGLQWQPDDHFTLRLDYGVPLIAATDEGNSLQENGFYFSIDLQPF